MDAIDALGLLLPALEKVGNRIIGFDDKIRRKFDRALETALRQNDELYIEKAKVHMAELVGLILLVMDEPSSINNIPLPNYINRDEFRRFYDQIERDEILWRFLQEEWNKYKAKDTNTTLKAIDERIKELTHSVDKISKKIECDEETNKEFIRQCLTRDADKPSSFSIEYFARDLLNGDIESFLNRMKSFFADTPYDLIRDLENHYQNMTYTICRLLGFYTIAEYHTSKGRIDMVVKTQQFIYVFEFKFNKTAEEALAQIDEKDYPLPFRLDGRKVYKVGINFSSKTNNMDKPIWKIDQPDIEVIKDKKGYNIVAGNLNPQSPLNELLDRKLENKRKHHPSFQLMEIDNRLFPNATTPKKPIKLEALDSNDEQKTVGEIIAESWGKNETNHLMIEGKGGIGKTVTLLSIPDTDKFAHHYVPAIYIPLHELPEGDNPIECYIKKKILNNKDNLYDDLLELIEMPWDNGPKLLLLLDGFNEISAEHRVTISKDIKYWSEYEGIQIITSSRYDIHSYVALGDNCSAIKLLPLSEMTVEEYLKSKDICPPTEDAVKKLITTPLLLTLYAMTGRVMEERESHSSDFKEVKNAGSLVWNYLQCELWNFGKEGEDAKNAIVAMEFIAPYMAWRMQQKTLFVLNKKEFHDILEEAYNQLERHFNNSDIFPFHIQDALQISNGIPPVDLIRNLLENQLCLFIKSGNYYRLMHQQFRDALAAMHLINSSYLSGGNIPEEWKSIIDYYVMQFVEDLISEDEAKRLWEQNRKTTPQDENATRNQLRLQGLLHNNDFTHLNFSALDLREISMYSYRKGQAKIQLPNQWNRMNGTRFSYKTFLPQGHQEVVTSVALTPNGKRIVSGSYDGTMRVWDMETGLPMGKPIFAVMVRTVAVTPDGKCIVCGSDDGTIGVWDLETGCKIDRLIMGHEGPVNSVVVTSDGKRIVSGSVDCTIRVWNLKTGCPIGKPIEGHEDRVTAVTVTPDGRSIISGSWDNTIRVWDLKSGRPIGKPIEGHEGWIRTVAVTPDGKYIVSGSDDCTIRVWDLETGNPMVEPIKGHDGSVRTVAITPDGKCIVSGSVDRTIRVWNLKTGGPMGKNIEGHKGSVIAVAVTPDGKHIVSGSEDQSICVWNMESGVATWEPIEGHEDSVCTVAVTPDGKHIVSGSEDLTIRIWNLRTCRLTGKPIEGHKDWVLAVAVTPDGKHIISGSKDHTICVWNLKTGRPLGKPIEGHEGSVGAVAITPDGKCIVSGSVDRTIRVWNLKTGRPLRKPIGGHEGPVTAVAVTPNGKCIVSGSVDGTIRVWDLETGKLIREPIEGHNGWVMAVAVTPNGKRIVSAADDNTIRIWDLETGRLIGKHEVWVNAVAVTPDGKRIISVGSIDCQIYVWDLETGAPIGKPIKSYGFGANAIAVTPDGKHIVSSEEDGIICITDMQTHKAKTIKILPLSFVGLDFSKAIISPPELKEILRQNGAKV